MVLPSKPESLYFLFPEAMFCCFVFFWGVLFSGSLCQAPETLWTCSQGCHCLFFPPYKRFWCHDFNVPPFLFTSAPSGG